MHCAPSWPASPRVIENPHLSHGSCMSARMPGSEAKQEGTSSKGVEKRNLHNVPTACGSPGQLLPPRRRRPNPEMAAAAPDTAPYFRACQRAGRRCARSVVVRARPTAGFVRGGLIYTRRLSLAGRPVDGLLVVAGLGEVRQTTPGGEAGLNKRPASGAGATCPATGGSPLPFIFPPLF